MINVLVCETSIRRLTHLLSEVLYNWSKDDDFWNGLQNQGKYY